ncbi:LysR family transcriptional regulator [Serratia ficaria]|uniref:D-malate degradation protein R n=1 Tax=Serratia ficaria TaxID=61651 RepID=A0A240ALI3_SERFI|nr:LysR family transcriptional regulator [Serratia ficaria]REF42017.1 DNA-binding transcriptional LysR family regulator [Serratia ficaria]CAI0940593.1 D-malate degradation protein R [Serratia ficaria]CAI0956598.1 D-malate degradation protein R [Serratia ficaria]CAI1040374.1 D-malate degradation protein R [Serratia ficaria]CAI2063432.1 D-malate degradation protein R [Serratia ficaria]
MDFNDIYYFYLVAENKGYAAAERQSGLTKSLLSRRVAQLEERLNVRLIQRNSRSFALTAAGRVLHLHAIDMVKEGTAAYDSLSALTSEPNGLIRVSSPTVLAQYHLAAILPGFMTLYPQVRVTIDATDRPVQVIEERMDLVLRARKRIDDEPGLIARPLATSRLILVASPGFLEQHGVPESPAQLANMGTLSSVLDRFEGVQKWELTNNNTGEILTINHTPLLFCLNPRVQLEAVIHGIGIGLIPDVIAYQSMQERKIVQVLTPWATHNHIIHAIFPSRKNMNPAVRAFLDYLIVHLPETLRTPKLN